MDDDFIVTTFVVFDKTMAALGHRDHALAQASDAEVLTVAVVAAKSFQNHLERALQVMHLGGYLSGALSVSRFNRRLHALRGWLLLLLAALGAVFAHGEVFLLDSMPLPVCRRARARRCRKVRGADYCGSCAAKRERFFGWRLHLACTPAGVPVACDLVPGGLHDLTPIHELTRGLPAGSTVCGDKGYNAAADEATILADSGVRLVPIRRANMRPNRRADKLALREYRKRIEALYSQSEALGVQRLRARTNPGLELKVHASLLAATITTAH
ncbi:MAG TPA: IS982 family transposase [Thermomicrobiales bacterium]|nr:IS982 family transposase [Thermomicrobiales bacterium]